MSIEVYESHLDLIQRVIGFVCRRQHFVESDAEDFRSYAHLRLLSNDCRALGQYQGDSSLRTYLVAVIIRIGLDYRIKKWGKWRPSAVAKRLGRTAIELETLLYRDGHSLDHAASVLKTKLDLKLSDSELSDLAAQLPARFRKRLEGEETLQNVASENPDPESRIFQMESRRGLERAFQILREALTVLAPEERTILRLHFEERLKWKEIADALGFDQKALYRMKDRALAKLKAELEKEGISSLRVLDLAPDG